MNNENKPLLVLETSGEICGVCVYYNETKYAESTVRIKNVHSEKLIQLVEQTLSSAGAELKDVRAVAVSSGPGSFTGLRIGMSTAKGIAFGASLPVVAVPTFDALALQISQYMIAGAEFSIANKVNVDEVYFASFVKNSSGSTECSEQISVIPRSQLDNIAVDAGKIIYGNALPGNRPAWPSPLYIAKWADMFGKDLLNYDYDYAEPFYLKNFVAKKSKPVI